MIIKGKNAGDENYVGKIDLIKGGDYLLGRGPFVDKMTSPPGAMTESELLGKMEGFHIGTDASMAVHVKNIIDREYVKVDGNDRKLIPTDLGSSLIESLY